VLLGLQYKSQGCFLLALFFILLAGIGLYMISPERTKILI